MAPVDIAFNNTYRYLNDEWRLAGIKSRYEITHLWPIVGAYMSNCIPQLYVCMYNYLAMPWSIYSSMPGVIIGSANLVNY